MDAIIQSIVSAFTDKLPKPLIILIISMIPILELRGSILAAGLMKMDFLPTFLAAVIGNLLPIPFILIFITKILSWMKTTKHFGKVALKLENKAMGKSDQIKKYGKFGLFLFVAIPLPGTGAWTGSLIAALLGFKTREAFPWIVLGVLTAGLIMSLIAFGILKPIVS